METQHEAPKRDTHLNGILQLLDYNVNILKILSVSTLNPMLKNVAHLASQVYLQNKLLSFMAIFLMILVGAIEAISVVSLVPVIEYLSGSETVSKYTSLINETLMFFGMDLSLRNYLGIFGFVVLTKSFVRYFAKYLILKIQIRYEVDLSSMVLKSLLYSSGSFLNSLSEGRVTNLLSGEVKKIGDCLYYLYDFSAVFIRFSFYSAVIFSFSIPLAICIIALSLLMASPSFILTKFIHRKSNERIAIVNDLQDLLIQIITNFSQIKNFCAENFFYSKYKEKNSEYGKTHGSIRLCSDLSSIIFEPMGVIQIFVIIYLSLNVFNLNFAEILVILFTLRTSVPLLGQMLTYHQVLVSSAPSFSSVMDMHQSAIENKENYEGLGLESFENTISLKGVYFRYGQKNVLKNLTFELNKGDFVGIVGPSGSGKSTLIKLLTAMLKPTEGSITIDDQSLSNIAVQSWRKQIGLVPQNPILLKTTLERNITLGENETDQNRLKEALRDSNLTSVIEALPDQLNTKIGHSGMAMSGGQVQRLAIARALYKTPNIVLLDEPTSSLDSESEREIFKALERIKGTRTVILVTHDLCLVELCNKIFVLNEGHIVESGSYHELMSAEGYFQRLKNITS